MTKIYELIRLKKEVIMLNFDGTGPEGKCKLTGKGRGNCGGQQQNTENNVGQGFGRQQKGKGKCKGRGKGKNQGNV